jgi:hypothetical protein
MMPGTNWSAIAGPGMKRPCKSADSWPHVCRVSSRMICRFVGNEIMRRCPANHLLGSTNLDRTVEAAADHVGGSNGIAIQPDVAAEWDAIYGMTGGQMAPTSPLGMRTTSSRWAAESASIRVDGWPQSGLV